MQHVTPPGAVYALTGFDDQCGAVERATVVGTAQLAPGVVAGGIIAAGSITSAHIAPSAIGSGQINASEVQTRVSGTCPSGQFIHGINVDGSASCGVPATATAFVHTSSAANSSADCTFIDHPLINGDPNAMILATRIFRGYLPGGIGVYYGSFDGGPRWCIYLESGGPMPAENQFNVLVIKQ